MFQQCCAGRGAEFSLDTASVCGDVLQYESCGRGRDRNRAVSTIYMTASDVDRRNNRFVRCDLVHEQGNCGYVRYGVQRAYFVEMYIGDGNAVDLAFRIGYDTVYGHSVRLCSFGHIEL